MNITDELRKWIDGLYTPNSNTLKMEGERIADRIDAAHRSALEKLAAQLDTTNLGRGTCSNVHESPKDTPFWPSPHFKCSECGATHVSMEYVYYCPNCGREVVDECQR